MTWAAGSSTYAWLSRESSPFQVNFTRALIAFPLFVGCALAFVGGEGFQALGPTQLSWFLLGVVTSYGVGDALFLWSTRELGISSALAIASAYPLWAALGGVLLRGEGVGWLRGFGILAVIVGTAVVILSQKRSGDSPSQGKVKKGLLLALLTSILWGIHPVALSYAGEGVSVFVGNTVRMGFALVLIPLFSRRFFDFGRLVLPYSRLKKVLPIVVLEVFFGSLLFLYAMTHAPLSTGAPLSSLAPVLSVPLALALGLERFSAQRLFGVILVVAGVSLLVQG